MNRKKLIVKEVIAINQLENISFKTIIVKN